MAHQRKIEIEISANVQRETFKNLVEIAELLNYWLRKVQTSMQNLKVIWPLCIVLFKTAILKCHWFLCTKMKKETMWWNHHWKVKELKFSRLLFHFSIDVYKKIVIYKFHHWLVLINLSKNVYLCVFEFNHLLQNGSFDLFFQCISKIFCNNYNWERMSPSLIVRKPKPNFASLNLKSAISHFSVWVL